MTTVAEARDAIYKQWIAGFTAHPYQLEGELEKQFTPPTAAPWPWARLSVRIQLSAQHTLGRVGTRRFRRKGTIYAQLFDKKGLGLATLDGMSQTVIGIYEGASFDGISCYAAVPREQPPEEKWQGIVVGIPFDFDETR